MAEASAVSTRVPESQLVGWLEGPEETLGWEERLASA